MYLPNAKGGSKLFTTISVPFTPEETTIHIITSLDPGMEFRIRIRAAGIAGLESASSPEIITATSKKIEIVLKVKLNNSRFIILKNVPENKSFPNCSETVSASVFQNRGTSFNILSHKLVIEVRVKFFLFDLY